MLLDDLPIPNNPKKKLQKPLNMGNPDYEPYYLSSNYSGIYTVLYPWSNVTARGLSTR